MTIKEQLYRDLPEVYAELAIEEMERQRKYTRSSLAKSYCSNTITWLFYWSDSILGVEFWDGIFWELIFRGK